MKHYSALNWLILIILIAALTASVGLFSAGRRRSIYVHNITWANRPDQWKGLYRLTLYLARRPSKAWMLSRSD